MSQYGNRLLGALGIKSTGKQGLREAAEATSIPIERLAYYNEQNKLPSGRDLEATLQVAGLSRHGLEEKLGRRSPFPTTAGNGRSAISVAAQALLPAPSFETSLGRLYQADCLDLLPRLPDATVDLVFADPPFNLRKLYPSEVNDDLLELHYLQWCEAWLEELVRVTTWGGSVFVWNLPRWNSVLSAVLEKYLTLRHWIAVDIKYSLPLPGRLYPSHYSLLYYTKGPRPKTFHPDRLPMQICPKCMADLRDYGGYKHKMNPSGVNLADVWYDISPVRHRRYKKRNGANELPLQLMDRVIEMASDPGDLVLDPFGGSGTTFAAAELKGRRWTGVEIGPIDDIAARLSALSEEREHLARIRAGTNCLFRADHRAQREQLGLWTDATFR